MVNDRRASTAAARSGLSSTTLSVRICSRLCRTVSSSFTTAGYNRASTCAGRGFAVWVLGFWGGGFVDCWEESRVESKSRSRWMRREMSW